MRVWDLPVRVLCRQHLLGEHRELHAVAAVLWGGRGSSPYRRHPETLRWVDRWYALSRRHVQQVQEMERRGWTGHATPMPGSSTWYRLLPARRYAVSTLAEQVRNLRGKRCGCDLGRWAGL